MSVRVMAMVFDRYPTGGGEMLLALALADHAHDDGTSVRPGIAALAVKTRQSERTVQYQLRRMEQSGWLILVNDGHGGRSMCREYRISPDWLAGAELYALEKGATGNVEGGNSASERVQQPAPINPEKGAIHDIKGANGGTKGCNPAQERVQPVAPAYNHQLTIKEPSKNHTHRKSASHAEVAMLTELGVGEQVARDWLAIRKRKRLPLTQTALEGVLREVERAGWQVEDALRVCCKRGWAGFEAEWVLQRGRASPGGQPMSRDEGRAVAARTLFGRRGDDPYTIDQ